MKGIDLSSIQAEQHKSKTPPSAGSFTRHVPLSWLVAISGLLTLTACASSSANNATNTSGAPTQTSPGLALSVQNPPAAAAQSSGPAAAQNGTQAPTQGSATAPAATTGTSANSQHATPGTPATADTAQPSSELASNKKSPEKIQQPLENTTAVEKSANAQLSSNEFAQLKVEVMSLREKVATLQRKFEVILKGQRSGLYEDDSASIRQAVSNANSANRHSLVPALGTAGPLDRFENEFDNVAKEKSLMPESAQKIVDNGVALLEQGEFGRAAQSLENFQQRFPNSPLSNIAELTLAEAYVELKSPQQALPHLRTFYLQHPNDPQLPRAKWLEGRIQELSQAPQKAAQLYREVIALSPQSDVALRARAALEKIAGGSLQ
ncbi:outer membrane protein assembly factor BamD [bacterium]|nr:outer membrane protein assembly factor BamD [bacterium]